MNALLHRIRISVVAIAVAVLANASTASIASAAISFGSVATGSNSSDPSETSSITIGKPSSTASGDFLLASITFNGGEDTVITAPSGWTLIERTDDRGIDDDDDDDDEEDDEIGAIGMATYYKFASDSEPADFTWGLDNQEGGSADEATEPRAAGGIMRYSGVHATAPVDVQAENEGHGDELTAPSVTTTFDDDLVVVLYGQDDDRNHPTPSGTTERFDVENSDHNGPEMSAADFTQAAAGPTGDKTIDLGSSQEDYVAQTIAVRMAPIITMLTLAKTVTNDDGGAAVATDWTLTASSTDTTTKIMGTTGAGTITAATVQAGTYILSESGGPAGYTAGAWSCTGDVTVSEDDQIALVIGQVTTCTIANDDQPVTDTKGTLIVQKAVINDNGGTATADNFSFVVGDGSPVAFEEDGENRIVVEAGTYAVTEVAASGYAMTYEGCSGIEVPVGGEATCTITNNDIASESPAPQSQAAPSGGGGNNGPIFGSFGVSDGGQVLGAATTTLPNLPAGCSALINTYMREGKLKNDPAQVRALQEFLNEHLSLNIPVTGYFGPLTTAAVKQFQLKHADQILTPWGLTEPTGFVYKTTQRAINLAHCSSLTIPMPTDLTPYAGE